MVGDFHAALSHCEQALALLTELDDRQGLAATWDSVRLISDVVAVCCSTADAIVVVYASIRPMTSAISPMATAAFELDDWIAVIRAVICSVA